MSKPEQPGDLTEKDGGLSPLRVTSSAAPGDNRRKPDTAGQTVYELSFP